MLFPTAVFTFLFLPIALAVFFALGRFWPYGAASWLFTASLFFYGYWMPEFTLLLVGSIVVNFHVGKAIGRKVAAGDVRRWLGPRGLLIAGVTLNLSVLGYFKYANFFVDNLNAVTGFGLDIGRVILPIGISFYTFTQIAFLADAYSKGVKEYRFAHYGLFVTYFPHLVAGPILHHAQMMPQFADSATYRPRADKMASGLAIFTMGLFKKIVLADGIAPYATAIFSAADAGSHPSANEAWLGAIAYTMQLYFDFSGYSDMAVGLSLLFNVRLPFNFDSPYKAQNIVDFWRRWHMSLSNFLRDYLYVPLGGNRLGNVRRYVNLIVTMLLGGLWHGASWTFVFWGALHGAYLVANHAIRVAIGDRGLAFDRSLAWRVASQATTFLCVVIAWVFFRSSTFDGALSILHAMASPSRLFDAQAVHPLLWNAGLLPIVGWGWCAALSFVTFTLPNSNAAGDWLARRCCKSEHLAMFTTGVSLTLIAFLIALNESRESVSAFIYFNF